MDGMKLGPKSMFEIAEDMAKKSQDSLQKLIEIERKSRKGGKKDGE